MASRPPIRNGTYRIKSESQNLYLDCSTNSSVTTQPFSPGLSQQWHITPAGDGDYELQSAANREILGVNDQNQLVCSPSLRRVTWTIEPRGFEAYVIGNAADALAMQLPIKGPVAVATRDNGARQRWVVEQDTLLQATRPNPTNNTTGFPTGTYFEIRARGSNNVLLTRRFSGEDGTQLIFWARPTGGNELRAAAFFIDRTGALCHSSGLNVDIVDNVPVLRHRRPVFNTPNPWSHPFPRFSYEDSQIQIEFNSDPSLPSCSEHLYPNESWRFSHFVLARNSSRQIFHMHPLSDFRPWALRVPFTPLPHSTIATAIDWGVIVEPRSGNNSDERTLWDIIPLRS